MITSAFFSLFFIDMIVMMIANTSDRGSAFLIVVGIFALAGLFILGASVLKPVWLKEEVQKPLETIRQNVQEKAKAILPLPENFSVKNLVEGANEALRGEQEGRINILILGIGGEGHNGPLLTDTMMLASFVSAKSTADIFSIPRDLAVRVPGKDTFVKINALYTLSGEAAFPNPGGIELTKTAVEKVTGLPLHYYIIIDFKALVKVIDLVGGIFVPQDETFKDIHYPTQSFGTQTFEVPAGWRYLNGDDALKYVRSRKSDSDFARMRRQHIVLTSLVQKIKGLNATQDLPLLLKLYDAVRAHIATDGSIGELERVWQLTQGFSQGNAEFHVLSSEPGNFLVSRLVEWSGQQAYILQPKTGAEEYGDIQKFIQEKIQD